ncbi:MAG: DUF4270 family protein [Bacteroidetes bacterium]|nr:DUF4270 family protein [Bacteroidota bacterium]
MKTVKNIVCFLVLVIVLSACKKDHQVLGADVQPEDDVLGASFTDATPLYLHTIAHKPTFSFPSEIKFLGSNQDPVFGRTDVGLYTNLNIPNAITNVSFGADANLVSAEIILVAPSLDFLGNYFTPLSYTVFPVQTALSTSSVYFTNNDSLYNKNAMLGSYTGTFTVIDGKLALRIPIDQNYAQSILNNTQYLVDNATFQSVYKGFYISCEGSSLNPVNAQGMISKFSMNDPLTGLYLYYQNGTPSAIKENKSFRFAFTGTGSVKLNTVKYQPVNGAVSSLYSQLTGDTVKGQQNLFLKGLAGTKLKLYMPTLKSYADSFKVAVNRAEIVLNVDPSFTSSNAQYFAPPYLALLAMDSLSRESFVLDQLSTVDAARYDGIYDNVNNRYVFNIARHVQAIFNGVKKNYGFYVVVADPSALYTVKRDNNAERVVIAGISHSTLKPKLNLSYVKFKKDK